MRRAIFPGSFDPLTNGHLDIIRRSVPLIGEQESDFTVVAINEILKNISKHQEKTLASI